MQGLARAFLFTALVFSASPASAQTAPIAISDWAGWSANFAKAIEACIAKKQDDCLAKAFNDRPRPDASGTYVDDLLYRDLQTAEVMLHQKDASDLLWKQYGIDSSDYLGTGYSVPLTGPGARDYQYAQQREYFVPNLCAEAVDPATCPAAEKNVWTWRLSSAQLTHWLDRPIVSLLRQVAPQSNDQPLPKFEPVAAGALPQLLIRFGALPIALYKGTVGRPGAVRVFFADYGQARDKTLGAAMTATGAASLIEHPDPAKTYFVWIYAPGADSKATVASWSALFATLSAQR